MATSKAPLIPTWIRNEDNVLDISHNLFCDSARFDLDVDLLNEAVFFDPSLFYSGTSGVDDPVPFRVWGNASEAVGAGRWIGGSTDEGDWLHHNGGRDFSGFPVSQFDPPNIGAYNGPLVYCGEGAASGMHGAECVCPVQYAVSG